VTQDTSASPPEVKFIDFVEEFGELVVTECVVAREGHATTSSQTRKANEFNDLIATGGRI
jgi:hypothetical protein